MLGVVCPVEFSFSGGDYGFVFKGLENNVFRGVFWREVRAAGLAGQHGSLDVVELDLLGRWESETPVLKAFFSNVMCVRVILSFLREDCGKKEDGELQIILDHI